MTASEHRALAVQYRGAALATAITSADDPRSIGRDSWNFYVAEGRQNILLAEMHDCTADVLDAIAHVATS